jgi:cytochrome c oxidase subunit 2
VLFPFSFAGIVAGGCSQNMGRTAMTPSSLDAQGPGAARIAELWWLMLGLSVPIILLILGVVVFVLLRRRAASGGPEIPPAASRGGRNWLLWGGVVMPAVVVAIVLGFTIRTLAALAATEAPIEVEVTGRRWWWEIVYPGHGVITANELHIPVGTPVRLTLQSADVIHSFWAPQLHGKMDLIPGSVNQLVIEADETGVYRGVCAEFCGVQHTHMGFLVVAQTQEEFERWLAAQQQPAAAVEDGPAGRGQQVFLAAGCAYCHRVDGLEGSRLGSTLDASVVGLGPDLTHLNSRSTIAAGTLANNRGNLAGWVANPQHTKPGSLMPPTFLPAEDFHALLAYLESLD